MFAARRSTFDDGIFVKSVHLYDIINDIFLDVYMGVEEDRERDRYRTSIRQPYKSYDMAALLKHDCAPMTWSQTWYRPK